MKNLRHIFVKIWGSRSVESPANESQETNQQDTRSSESVQPTQTKDSSQEVDTVSAPDKNQSKSGASVEVQTSTDINQETESDVWWECPPQPKAPKNEVFHFDDGTAAETMLQLQRKLKQMSEEQYHHYASGHQNDFAVWIEEVLGDSQAARALEHASHVHEAIDIINLQLQRYDA